MIDWTQRLYDNEGVEHFLVRDAQGIPLRTSDEGQYWVHNGSFCKRVTPEGTVRGGFDQVLSNSPLPSWERETIDPDFSVKLRYGKREGVWFAEVVQ